MKIYGHACMHCFVLNTYIQVQVTNFPQNAKLIVWKNLQEEFSLTSAELLYMEKADN